MIRRATTQRELTGVAVKTKGPDVRSARAGKEPLMEMTVQRIKGRIIIRLQIGETVIVLDIPL